jgi:hypothetical protein
VDGSSVRMVQPIVISVCIPTKAYKSIFHGLEVMYRRRDRAPDIRTRAIAIIQRNSIVNRHSKAAALFASDIKVLRWPHPCETAPMAVKKVASKSIC